MALDGTRPPERVPGRKPAIHKSAGPVAISGEKGLWTVQQLAEVALDGTRMALGRPDGNDERTRTLTITEAGVPLGQSTPEDSRPPAGDLIQSMEEIGRATAIARKAADGTRWCRCCDTTAAAGRTSAYCPSHRAERNPYLKRLRRQEERAAEAARAAVTAVPVLPPGKVLADEAALRFIAGKAAHMAVHVARASRHYHALRSQDAQGAVWLDNLMWSAKELDAAIESGITNGEVLLRRTARPQP